MNRFIDSLLLAFKGDTDEKLFINKADSNEKLNKLYDDFEKKAGIEDISLKNELFDVVFAHAVEYERFKIENNNVLMFLEECTQPIDENKFTAEFKQPVTTGAVYRCYTYWAKNSGETPVKRQAFRSIVASYYKSENGADIERKYNGNLYYRFFTLTQNAMNENGY